MKIKIYKNTIIPMINICEKHKEGKLRRKELEELLEAEEYKVEIERYNQKGAIGGFSKEEFIDFFMNIFILKVEEMQNTRLQLRYTHFMEFFNNLDYYKDQIKILNELSEEDVEEALKYTFYGLPNDIDFKELNLIFSIGLGNSGGWFYKNYSHYDIIQFLKDFDIVKLKNAIAHETHHIGMVRRYFEKLDISKVTLENYFYLFLSLEGLAVKYCNNGRGFLTKNLYEGESNKGLDKYTWNYLNNNFLEIYNEFRIVVKKIRNCEIRTLEELEANYIAPYWLSMHENGQSNEELPKLLHSRNYSLGNDIWGLIQDVYGRDKVFETLDNLQQFPEVFNSALRKIGKEELCL